MLNLILGFEKYLVIEKSSSKYTVENYCRDVTLFLILHMMIFVNT